MPPLEIRVSGNCQLNRTAERAFVTLRIAAESTNQEEAAQNATTTVNNLHQKFTFLSPKTAEGAATPDAPITIFTVSSVSTSSKVPKDGEGKPNGPREYTASATISAIFRDFANLSEVTRQMLDTPFVEVQSITWRLTDDTKNNLAKEAREKALVDAVEKAKLYARVVGREVSAVEITDTDNHQVSRRMMQSYNRTAAAWDADGVSVPSGGIALEPQEVVVDCSIKALFVTEDWTREKAAPQSHYPY
ncbi:hypothetical protein AJ79_02549 [Helicocarpus griseus UAMH5409]|uniref:SIMPL domain-containing protein n=1 Tax=Helicocarpus griseus UAMH5409 TaxID=1447875 RepID=A0A2B7XTT9_9EURO|nr:hypothetical protein AJ79_02549 [Helicocarpus griseus UAMH5409]